MSAPSGPERRRDPRYDDVCRVEFRILREGKVEPKTTAGRTVNLSASGLCLEGPKKLDRDSQLALAISLPGKAEPVVAMGRVVWCERQSEQWRTGVAFSWLRDEDRKALAAIADYLRHRPGG